MYKTLTHGHKLENHRLYNNALITRMSQRDLIELASFCIPRFFFFFSHNLACLWIEEKRNACLWTLPEVVLLNLRQHMFSVPGISMWTRIPEADNDGKKDVTQQLEISALSEQLNNLAKEKYVIWHFYGKA